MKYYYYTKWTFKRPMDDIGCGPFHSTWVTEQEPTVFISGTCMDMLSEFFVKAFETEEEMREYAAKVGL
jgi:hypothetical protein